MPASREKTPAQRFDKTIKKLFQTLPSRIIESIVKEEGQRMALELSIEDNAFLRGAFLEGAQKVERRWRRSVSRLLEQRFGKLPKWALQQLEKADAATLERWEERILKAESLEEIIPKPHGARSRVKR